MRTRASYGNVLCIAVASALIGCSDQKDDDGGGIVPPGDGSTDGGEDDPDGDGETDSGDPDDGATDTGDGADEPTDTGGGDDGSFIMEPDGGGADNQCDIWAQDCAVGEKCMPWANDGGSSWNATKCTPEAENPGEPGDECTVEGNDVSGVDSCKAGSMCFAVDPETNVGTCAPFCNGSPDAPVCDDPGQACNISNDGVLILCLDKCDPILQDCPQGSHVTLGCYPVVDNFLCWSDYSWDLGNYADPCEYFNVCDPGLFCAIPDLVPNCVGALGCCTEFCDLGDPNASAACAGAADGQECIPFYDMGAEPPGTEHIGACGMPA